MFTGDKYCTRPCDSQFKLKKKVNWRSREALYSYTYKRVSAVVTHSGRLKAGVSLQLLFRLFLLLLKIKKLGAQQLLTAFNPQESDNTWIQQHFVYKMHKNSHLSFNNNSHCVKFDSWNPLKRLKWVLWTKTSTKKNIVILKHLK